MNDINNKNHKYLQNGYHNMIKVNQLIVTL